MTKPHADPSLHFRSAEVTTYPDTGETAVFIEYEGGRIRSGRFDSPAMQQLLRLAREQGVEVKHRVVPSRKKAH